LSSHTDTTFGRTLLDEGSVRRRDLFLAAHCVYKRQTPKPPVLFAIPANERPQKHALDRAAPGIIMKCVLINANETQNFGLSTEGKRSLNSCNFRREDNIKINQADYVV
jgi:hypothetical protein